MTKNILDQINDGLLVIEVDDAKQLVETKDAKYVDGSTFLNIGEKYFILRKDSYNGPERTYYELLRG